MGGTYSTLGEVRNLNIILVGDLKVRRNLEDLKVNEE
jgi:hypothetical protein